MKIIKWPGGKAQIADTILAKLGDLSGRRYVEPFFGSGDVFFALRAAGFTGSALLADLNADVVNLWRAVRDAPSALAASLREVRVFHDALVASGKKKGRAPYGARAAYGTIRDLYNSEGNVVGVRRAALMVYLSKTSYGGVWRVNAAGGFNVPSANRVDPALPGLDEIGAAAAALRGVALRCGDAATILDGCGDGDTVYLDPPYLGGFVGYVKEGWTAADHARLVAAASSAASRGARVVVSDGGGCAEAWTAAGFDVEWVGERRAVNRNVKGRGAVECVLAESP